MNCSGENVLVVLWIIREQKSGEVCATQSVGRELWQKCESTKSVEENLGQQQAPRGAVNVLSWYRDTGANTWGNKEDFQLSLFSTVSKFT